MCSLLSESTKSRKRRVCWRSYTNISSETFFFEKFSQWQWPISDSIFLTTKPVKDRLYEMQFYPREMKMGAKQTEFETRTIAAAKVQWRQRWRWWQLTTKTVVKIKTILGDSAMKGVMQLNTIIKTILGDSAMKGVMQLSTIIRSALILQQGTHINNTSEGPYL